MRIKVLLVILSLILSASLSATDSFTGSFTDSSYASTDLSGPDSDLSRPLISKDIFGDS